MVVGVWGWAVGGSQELLASTRSGAVAETVASRKELKTAEFWRVSGGGMADRRG